MRTIEELSEDELENYFNLSTVSFIPIPRVVCLFSIYHRLTCMKIICLYSTYSPGF